MTPDLSPRRDDPVAVAFPELQNFSLVLGGPLWQLLRKARMDDDAGRLVDADGDGLPGGWAEIQFDTMNATPIPGTAIDLWSAQGDRVGVAVSGLDGEFAVGGVNQGAYALSSDAPGPYIDQVHAGIACPNGSAYEGRCALTGATYVTLPNYDPGAPLIEFRLAPIDPIFANAFD